MKLKHVKIKNIKNLTDLEFGVPDAPVIYVTGPNGSGKTAVLDSIAMALSGKRAITKGSMTNGALSALIELEMDEGLKVERKITDKGAYLKIFRGDGSEAPAPQKILDQVLGPICMDPWGFIQGKAKDRRELILKSAGVEDQLVDIEIRDKDAREERRLAKRALKETEAQIKDNPPLDPDVPSEPVDTQKMRQREIELVEIHTGIDRGMGRVSDIVDEKTRLKARLEELEIEQLKIQGWLDSQDLSLLPALREDLAKAEEINRQVSEQANTRLLDGQKKTQGDRVDLLEARVGKIELERKDLMVKVADTMDLDGLEIEGDEILINEIPFPQLSTAQRLRVAVALAVRENPELRLVRIVDGSVLDEESRKYLDEVAREEGLQIWVEDVRETGVKGIEISIEA